LRKLTITTGRLLEREFRRAIDLDPNYATAHQWYGEYLSWQGRFEEAWKESERARQLDPMSLIIASDQACVLYRARQYDRAIAQFRAILDMDPAFRHPYVYLLISDIRTGRFTDALDVINRYIRPLHVPWAREEEAIVYGYWGRKAEAEKALAEFESSERAESFAHVNLRLEIYIATGRRDQAIALLEKLFAEHSRIIPTLKTEPIFDPLRSDPRFQDLLRQVGLSD
jgi:tetratricopeptide (TPR) repeat protein